MSTALTTVGLGYCLSFSTFYALNVLLLEYIQTKQHVPLGQLMFFRGTLVIWVIAVVFAAIPQSREIILQGFDLAFGTQIVKFKENKSLDPSMMVDYPQMWILISSMMSSIFGMVCWLICLKEMSSGDMILILEVSNTTIAVLYAIVCLRERINLISMCSLIGIIIGMTIMVRPTFLFGSDTSRDGNTDKNFRNYNVWSILSALGVAASYFISDVALYRFRNKVDSKVLTLARLWQGIVVSSIAWLFILVVFGFKQAWHPLSDFPAMPLTILWMLAPLNAILGGCVILALTSVPFYFFNCMGSLTTLLCYLMDVWLLNEVESWSVYTGAAIIVGSLVFLTCNVDNSSTMEDESMQSKLLDDYSSEIEHGHCEEDDYL